MSDERERGVCLDIRKLIDDLKLLKNHNPRGGLAEAMRMIQADVRYSCRETEPRFALGARFDFDDKEQT